MTSLEAAYCQWLERMALAQRECQESKRVVSSYQSHGLPLPAKVARQFTRAHESLHKIARDFPDPANEPSHSAGD